MSVKERLMAWLIGITAAPPQATNAPAVRAAAARTNGDPPAKPDPRILELDKINRDNDARLERLGLSRAVLEERMMAGDVWESPQEVARDR